MSQTVLQLLTFHERRVTKISVVGVTTVLTQRVIVYNRFKGKMFYISRSLEQMEVTSTDAYTSMHTTEYTRTTEPHVHMSNITADILQSTTNEPPPGMTLASPYLSLASPAPH